MCVAPRPEALELLYISGQSYREPKLSRSVLSLILSLRLTSQVRICVRRAIRIGARAMSWPKAVKSTDRPVSAPVRPVSPAVGEALLERWPTLGASSLAIGTDGHLGYRGVRKASGPWAFEDAGTDETEGDEDRRWQSDLPGRSKPRPDM